MKVKRGQQPSFHSSRDHHSSGPNKRVKHRFYKQIEIMYSYIAVSIAVKNIRVVADLAHNINAKKHLSPTNHDRLHFLRFDKFLIRPTLRRRQLAEQNLVTSNVRIQSE
jgi:hypothetical protein